MRTVRLFPGLQAGMLVAAILAACAAPARLSEIVPTPTPSSATPQPTTSAATRVYVLEIEELAFNLKDAMSELGRLLVQASPSDTEWVEQAAAQIGTIERMYGYARTIEPPSELEQAHAIAVEAAATARAGCYLILHGDPEGGSFVDEATELFSQAGARMDEASQLLHDYMRRHD